MYEQKKSPRVRGKAGETSACLCFACASNLLPKLLLRNYRLIMLLLTTAMFTERRQTCCFTRVLLTCTSRRVHKHARQGGKQRVLVCCWRCYPTTNFFSAGFINVVWKSRTSTRVTSKTPKSACVAATSYWYTCKSNSCLVSILRPLSSYNLHCARFPQFTGAVRGGNSRCARPSGPIVTERSAANAFFAHFPFCRPGCSDERHSK